MAAKTEKKSTEEPNAGENHIQIVLPLTADSPESPAAAVAFPQQFGISHIGESKGEMEDTRRQTRVKMHDEVKGAVHKNVRK